MSSNQYLPFSLTMASAKRGDTNCCSQPDKVHACDVSWCGYSVSGVMDYYAENEAEGFEILRDLVATLNLDPPSLPPSGEEEHTWNQSLLDGEEAF